MRLNRTTSCDLRLLESANWFARIDGVVSDNQTEWLWFGGEQGPPL